ncbi:MAG: thiamine phosphate synthase [Hyphomonadaceae bacterium]|nr:thiamine phosphate synthase [Hyphomonadaceae bacterium]
MSHARSPPLPALWLFTDPVRTPDPLALLDRLPRGSAVVYRHFGAADRATTAARLAAACRRRGLVLLIGADPALALRAGADGVHLPERMGRDAGRLKRRRPGWIVTAAAHGGGAVHRARGADAAILSPVFASRSPSAGPPLGVHRAVRLMRRARTPVVALGGVSLRRARALKRLGFAGSAGVDVFVRGAGARRA